MDSSTDQLWESTPQKGSWVWPSPKSASHLSKSSSLSGERSIEVNVAGHHRDALQTSTHLVLTPKSQSKIQDYGIIGDCRSAALISRQGSLDWLCWPRFDSASIFAALLDSDRGGFWSIIPTAPYETERSYIENTNVLETRFTCAEGSA